jgi:putative redox protein
MAERVVIRQNDRFEVEVLASDPHKEDSDQMQAVEHLHGLTPYGMLLASLGSCTAILLHSYAQSRGLKLREVELNLSYARDFKQDCDDCEAADRYDERVDLQVELSGELTEQERERLFLVSRQCPIHKIIKGGIDVQIRRAQGQ